MSGIRTLSRIASIALLSFAVSCGDDEGEDQTASVRVSALATEATTLEGPAGTGLVVPAGASDEDVTIVLTVPRTRRQAPADTVVVGPAVTLDPEGKMFLAPLELTIPISPSSLPAGKTIDDVVVVRAPQGSSADAFVPIPTRREGNAVVASTEHFSDYLAVVSVPGEQPFGACTDGVCSSSESCSLCPFDCGPCLPSTDTTEPTVQVVESPASTTGVRGDAVFGIRFSEALLATSVSTSSVTILDATSQPIAGTVSASGALVTFTPAGPLLPAVAYTVSVTGVRDLAGNLMTTTFTQTYTTAARISLASATPADGATGVAQNAIPELAFSGAFASGTLTSQAADGACTGSVQISVDDFATCRGVALGFGSGDTTLELDAVSPFPSLAVVKLRFASAALDGNGFSLAGVSYQFTAIQDLVAPALAGVVPPRMATGVSIHASIVLTFSEPISPASVTTTTIALRQGAAVIPCSRSVVGSVVTVTPDSPLTYSTGYMLSVMNVLDLASNSTQDTILPVTFSTEVQDLTAPTLIDSSPQVEDVDVPLNPTITLTFSEPLDVASVNTTNIRLTQDGQPTAITVALAGNVVTVTPTAPLLPGLTYYLHANDLLDLAGNSTANSISSIYFQTASSPFVSDTYPREGALGVHPRADLRVEFSAALDEGTFTIQPSDSPTCAGTVQLSDGTTCYGGSVSFEGNTLVVQASTSLPLSGDMLLTILPGATSLQGVPVDAGAPVGFHVSPVNDFGYAFRLMTGFGTGNLGGLVGADGLCSSVFVTGSWKAFLVTENRYACTTSHCGTNGGSPADESADWVLESNTNYINEDSQLLFTTHSTARIPAYPSSIAHAIDDGLVTDVYFGGTSDWLSAGVGSACVGFTDGTSSNTLLTIDPTASGTAWLTGTPNTCDVDMQFFCVEQRPGVEPDTH